jgi:hypothetical protein
MPTPDHFDVQLGDQLDLAVYADERITVFAPHSSLALQESTHRTPATARPRAGGSRRRCRAR